MSEFLEMLDEIEVERILNMSHAELVEEIKARGENPDKIIREIDETIQRAKRFFYEAEKERQIEQECSNGPSTDKET
jgi:hypothetical protein